MVKVAGTPVNWFISYPARGVYKPGAVVLSQFLNSDARPLYPIVGDVRGIYQNTEGEFWVVVAFPWNFGESSHHHVDSVTGHFPEEWMRQGDWGNLQQYKRQYQRCRRAAGIPDSREIWSDDYVPVPANFYRGGPALHPPYGPSDR